MAKGWPVAGSMDLKVDVADDVWGWGLPEWKVWISDEKVMVQLEGRTGPELGAGSWELGVGNSRQGARLTIFTLLSPEPWMGCGPTGVTGSG